jgi:hypothetical protein
MLFLLELLSRKIQKQHLYDAKLVWVDYLVVCRLRVRERTHSAIRIGVSLQLNVNSKVYTPP